MERIDIQARDGTKLSGVLEKSLKSNAPLVILCHGLAVTKDEWKHIFVRLSEALQEQGIDVLRFDFRGHGESSGKQEDMTIFGEVLDLEAVIDYAKELGYTTIGLLGASFGGGAVASFLDNDLEEVKTAVLWNPLLDGTTLTEGKSPWAKKQLSKKNLEILKTEGYLPIAKVFKLGRAAIEQLQTFSVYPILARTNVPILIVHGDKDSYVPYSDSVKATVVGKNCTLELLDGAEHGFDAPKEATQQAIGKTVIWFKKHLFAL
jgi:uncharacterized protein